METSIKLGVAIVVICTVLFAGFGIIDAGNTSWPQHAAAFACFGFMIGAIIAFDSGPGDRQKNRPFLRILLSSAAGLGFGWVLDFPIEGILLSGLVTSILGYAGLSWAKYF
ncbi:hypothetical protein H8L32_16530 [Undibacterium sp. CY18W]|uniref:SPW repeat-containing protein n=1 Tax=Undibacterium hunanense TaxID=2762292 RepID=A0ABR6ZTB1_9BURK|nr:hypothetical protein [Undibacterium hunanense]MBC3919099.1 hypothetical protein [Undibacterium hunanense]